MCADENTTPVLAIEVLESLAKLAGASEIVIGGYFALQQRMNYRRTHDVDAWWRTRSSSATEIEIRTALDAVAARHQLALRERRFGETVSWEFLHGAKKIFSFQISVKSVEVAPPEPSAWPPLLIESHKENIASKMNALVGRGSPRDFRDIYETVTQNYFTASECWELWCAKNPGQAVVAAKQRVLLHLSALELRRPLASIALPQERSAAAELRRWFKEDFVNYVH